MNEESSSINYDIKRFSNKSSEHANPQLRSLSIIVSFNALFQGTDYWYTDNTKSLSKSSFMKVVNSYFISKKISTKDVVVFPLYFDEEYQLVTKFEFEESRNLCGFGFFLKNDLRAKFDVVKITTRIINDVFEIFKEDVADYNSFLTNDVWLIVVHRPYGKNYLIFGKDKIENKLQDIKNTLELEKKEKEAL